MDLVPPPPLDKSAPESFPARIGTLGNVDVWRSRGPKVTQVALSSFWDPILSAVAMIRLIKYYSNVLILEITPSSSNTNVMCLQINLIAIMSL